MSTTRTTRINKVLLTIVLCAVSDPGWRKIRVNPLREPPLVLRSLISSSNPQRSLLRNSSRNRSSYCINFHGKSFSKDFARRQIKVILCHVRNVDWHSVDDNKGTFCRISRPARGAPTTACWRETLGQSARRHRSSRGRKCFGTSGPIERNCGNGPRAAPRISHVSQIPLRRPCASSSDLRTGNALQ